MRRRVRVRRPSAAMVVACLALFVALGGSAMAAFVVSSNSQIAPNTIYGANRPNGANDNIVDGSVAPADIRPNSLKGDRVADAGLTGADLADGSVSGAKLTKNSVPAAKIANDSLTGTQINESSLGAVPTASSIDGYTLGSFYNQQASTHQQTSECTQTPQTWTECGGISVTVPANHLWYVTVISSVTANPGNANVEALFCPAYTGPQCLDSTPDRVTFAANQFGTWSGAYTASFTAGTYTFNTAMKWPFVVPGNSEGNTETTVIVSDYRQQQLTGP